MKVQAKIDTLLFRADRRSHIELDPAACAACQERPCLNICPAQMFTLAADDSVLFSHEGCLECGACCIVCQHLTWNYPRGGYGVAFREV
jgi:ferredoxin like protein